ncbi:hypothetical protein NUH88_02345 [Nisaea acidiphila]|uniref:Uncharacterized protein n=1 Tax=Nisaea acidiphila TaxID=1862145 RepID=A0A9J7AW95_9PROT|nr:hypothetical protein [Nisaea acidiphila]UUX50540.1 hypothetical protein NUH88_02345 [Nisaea acidiphila]
MTDYWDNVDTDGPFETNDLNAYLEERRRKAAQYLRLAKRAQAKIEKLQKIEEAHRKALGQND